MDFNDYSVESLSEGIDSLSVVVDGKKKYLHSKHNPLRESDIFRKDLEVLDGDTLIILGVGLGYSLIGNENLLKRFKTVFIIECLDLEKIFFEKHISNIRKKNIIFYFAKDLIFLEKEFSERLEISKASKISFLYHNGSFRIFNEYYKKVEQTVCDLINKKSANTATAARFSTLFLKNGIKHISRINDYASFRGLKGHYKGCYCILVSSAPSLFSSIDIIREYQNSCVIIAVDSAVSVLLSSGIKPDYVLIVDPQPWVNEHLLGYFDLCERFVCCLTSCPVIDRIPYKMNYLGLNSHPLSQMMGVSYENTFEFLDSGTGNVAGDALDFALFLGFDKVYLSGIDFSFPDYVIYAKGTAYQERYSKLFNSRFCSCESQNIDYIFKSSKGVKDKSGNYTRNSFIEYSIGFEKKFKQWKEQIYLLNTAFKSELFQHVDRIDESKNKKNKFLSQADSRYKKNELSLTPLYNLMDRDDVRAELFELAGVTENHRKETLLTIINNLWITC